LPWNNDDADPAASLVAAPSGADPKAGLKCGYMRWFGSWAHECLTKRNNESVPPSQT
jgi:hypothetical protein